MIIAFLQNTGFFEWLILMAIVFVVFRRSVARSLGHTVGTYSANPPGPTGGDASGIGTPQPAEPLSRYFSALDLPATASPEQIREAYRELVKVWHPDRFSDEKLKERANTKLKEINEAYEKLSAVYGIK